ncbi:MAG: hypothetical protein LBU14_01445 [Candidatus Peribacteria bacterium]|jgi:hypothetical protein|nr:hypothetical protein [Candidatus Peribacteria bacterium]
MNNIQKIYELLNLNFKKYKIVDIKTKKENKDVQVIHLKSNLQYKFIPVAD